LSALQDTLSRASHRTTEVLANWHLPHMPTREEFLAQAGAMFTRTRSLDEIVDRAYELLLESVGMRLNTVEVPGSEHPLRPGSTSRLMPP
jgi:stearoyl-CoA desaturase (Delta-9 desaturase)